MGVKAFQIVFQDNKEVFAGGDTIEGHVLLEFNKPQKARSKS